jgi:hypothetical protein
MSLPLPLSPTHTALYLLPLPLARMAHRVRPYLILGLRISLWTPMFLCVQVQLGGLQGVSDQGGHLPSAGIVAAHQRSTCGAGTRRHSPRAGSHRFEPARGGYIPAVCPGVPSNLPSPLSCDVVGLVQSVRQLQLLRKQRENAARKERLRHLAGKVMAWSHLFSAPAGGASTGSEQSEFPPPPPTRISVRVVDKETIEVGTAGRPQGPHVVTSAPSHLCPFRPRKWRGFTCCSVCFAHWINLDGLTVPLFVCCAR